MAKKLLLDSKILHITLSRLCQQVIENHKDFTDTVIVGLQPRGKFFAQRVQERIKEMTKINVPFGYIDATFFRDDFRRRDEPLIPSQTYIPFLLENKKVLLIDDVLFTGRTIRAALSAMMEFGRPAQVELMVLIDRKYTRHLPIEPNYTGKTVNTIQSQKVKVEWKEQGFEQDTIWLIDEVE